MKGCKALRHRFPFCGIESFLNSSLSLSLLSSVCRLFLSLSLLFFLFAVASVFWQSARGKRGEVNRLKNPKKNISKQMEAYRTDISLNRSTAPNTEET